MRSVFLLALLCACILTVGCATPPSGPQSIVGVWEMREVRIEKLSQMPPVELTNKKDVYTADGIYHDTAADSTVKTDTRTNTYKFEDGIVTIFREDGRKKLGAKVVFKAPDLMQIHADTGEVVVFRKVSDDPSMIPKLKERAVPVKMK